MRVRNVGRRSTVRWCVLAALAGSTAHADDTTKTLDRIEVTGTAEPSPLDEHPATGSRLGLSARETPATLDVVDQAQMQERGARTSIEAINAAPGVLAAALPSSPGITTMRGFSGGAISLLYDGIRQTAGPLVTRNYDAWSFERIEVLKGPASVLYGEGALAGAINLVPKRPALGQTHWSAMFGAGSFGERRAGIDVNAPLGDNAALRAVVSDSRSDGYVDDTDAKTQAGLVSFSWRPVDAVTLDVSLDRFRDDYGSAYWGTPLVPYAVARDPGSVVSTNNGYVIDRATRDANYDVADGYSTAEADWVRTRLGWQIDDTWRFVNELDHYDAQRRWRNTETYTWDAVAANLRRSTTLITHDHDYWVERASFAADGHVGGQRNRFSIGAEYSESDFYNQRRFGVAAPVDLRDPQRGYFPAGDEAALFPGAGNRVDFDSASQVTALFAENALNLGSRWLVLAGVRRDRIDLERIAIDYNTGTRTVFQRDYSPLTWRAGAVFNAAERTQIYTQYSRAVAPVGSLFLISQANAKFDLTTGDAFEVGVKSSLWDERIDLTAAAYWLRQDDIVTRDSNNVNLSIQGGRQSSRGIEVGMSARLTPRLRLDANLAVLDARFDALIEAGGANRAGNVPSNVPERVASVFAVYNLADTPVSLSLGARHVGRFYTNNANTIRVAAHTVVDAAVNWHLPLGELSLRGRNLTDALYADWNGGAADQILLGAPRGVELTWTVTR